MRSNADFPAVVRELALYGTFGPDPDFLAWWPWPERHAEQVNFFGTPRIVPQLYGWFDHAHDTKWGDWSADPAFVQVAGPVAAAGGAFCPYVLPHRITFGSEPVVPGYDAESLVEYAVVTEDGAPQIVPDVAGAPSFEVCLSTTFAREYVVTLATELRSLGAAGVYLDELNALPPQRCHARGHGHPPVDPLATRRRLELIDAVLAAVPGGEFYVASESVNEVYLGRIHVGLSQWTRNVVGTAATLVPSFETVYHDHLRVGRVGVALNVPNEDVLSGRIHVLARQTFAAHVALGRAPFTGALLNEDGLLDNGAASATYGAFLEGARRTVLLLERPEVFAHVAQGERLREPAGDAPRVDLAPLGRILDGLTLPGGKRQPLVYATAFGRPEDGSIVVLVSNWSEVGDDQLLGLPLGGGAQEYAFTVDAPALGYPAVPYRVTRIPESGPHAPSTLAEEPSQVVVAGTIGARSAEAWLLAAQP